MTTQEIADRLLIAPKTADHHIQHIDDQIAYSTRAAAARWAIQNAVIH
jgi:DNA-binding CsgD family transcriptional regulator